MVFLQLILSALTQTQVKWKITTLTPSGGSSIYMRKGRYERVKLLLSESDPLTSGLLQPGKIKLGLSQADSLIFELVEEIELDPIEAFEVEAYIGIKCLTNVNGQSSFTLTWTIQSSDIPLESLTVVPVTLSLFDNSNLFYYQNQYTAPMNSLSYIEFNDVVNIEAVEIAIDAPELTKTLITLPPFTNRRKNKSLFFPFKTGSAVTKVTYTLSIDTVNTCYTIRDNTFTVTVNSDKPASFTESSQALLANSIALKLNFDKASFTLGIAVPSYPVMMFCKATSSTKDFDDEDIRSQNKDNSDNSNYYLQSFLIYTTSSSIEFKGLNFFNEYTVKCILDTTQAEKAKQQSLSFIAGRRRGTDFNVALMPKYRNSNPAQCVTWMFKTDLEDIDLFLDQAALFCMKTFRVKNAPNENRCFPCSTRRIGASVDKASICMGSTHTCTSTEFFGNVTELFDQNFIQKLSTKQLIKDNMLVDLKSNDIQSLYREIDDIAPDKAKMTGKITAKSSSTVTFEVASQNEQAIECWYNDLNNDSFKWLLANQLKEHSVVLEKGIAKTITVPFRTGSLMDSSFNLVFNCRNLPGYARSYHQTGPFVLVTFIHSDETVAKDEEVKVDCTTNPYLSECIYKPKVIKHLKTNSAMRENNEDAIDNFLRLSHNEQKLQLKIEEKALISLNDEKQRINQMIKLSELLSQYNCYGYANCRQQKKAFHSQLMAILKTKFSICPAFFEELNRFGFAKIDDNAKMLFSLLETLSNNPDAINSAEDSNFITQMTLCLSNAFDELWAKVFPFIQGDSYILELHKRDMLIMLTRLTTNLIDINKFDQIDKYFDLSIIEKSGHFSNEKPRKAKEAIDKSFSLLSQLSNSTFLYDDLDSLMVHMITSATYYNRAFRMETNEWIMDIEMDFKGILSDFNAKTIVIMYYPYYPLFPMNSTVFEPKVFSFKLLSDKGAEIPFKNEYLLSGPQIILIDKLNSTKKFDDCYYYDFLENAFFSDKSDFEVSKSKNFCYMKFFSDFAFKYDGIGGDGLVWWAILLIVLAVVLCITVGLVIFIVIRKKRLSRVTEIANENSSYPPTYNGFTEKKNNTPIEE